MITGAAKIAGVVGWPVAHSLSPLIHNAWIEALGLDAVYVPFAVPPERFADFVAAAKGSDWLTGINVTLPHKESAYELASSRANEVVWAEAANLLLFNGGGGLHAENLDGRGLVSAFADHDANRRALNGPVLVLGAGGAARSALTALHWEGVPTIRVAARRIDAAASLVDHWDDSLRAEAYGFDQLDEALDGVSAVINATSAGLQGRGELPPMTAAPPEAVFMDMVYAPLWTTFLRRAAADGHATIDGLAMLIGQARPSFEWFFGVPAPPAEVVDVRALCLRALGEAP